MALLSSFLCVQRTASELTDAKNTAACFQSDAKGVAAKSRLDLLLTAVNAAHIQGEIQLLNPVDAGGFLSSSYDQCVKSFAGPLGTSWFGNNTWSVFTQPETSLCSDTFDRPATLSFNRVRCQDTQYDAKCSI